MRSIKDIIKLMEFVKENPINFTWVSPKTKVYQSTIPDAGKGRFATQDIKKNEIVVILGGLMLSEDEYQQIRHRFPFVSGLLIHEDFKIHQVNFSSEYNGTLNHSCNPNVYLNGQIVIKAIRPIKAGEEFFLDYGTISNQDLVLFEKCQCGADNCRKYITCKDWLSTSFRSNKECFFSHHLQELIRDISVKEIKHQLHSLKKIDVNKSSILTKEMNSI